MTNFILINQKLGHRVDIYKMEGKEIYAVIDNFGMFKDHSIIPDNEILDKLVTKMLDVGYKVFQGPRNRGEILP